MCQLGYSDVALRRLATGHQAADVVLNGRPAVFIVDTGANITVLDARYAETFGLKANPSVKGMAMALGGGLDASAWRVDQFDIGGVPTRQARIMTADLRQMTDLLDRVSASHIAGIIGQDVLRDHGGIVDVAGSTLFLAPDPRDPPAPPAERCASRGGRPA